MTGNCDQIATMRRGTGGDGCPRRRPGGGDLRACRLIQGLVDRALRCRDRLDDAVGANDGALPAVRLAQVDLHVRPVELDEGERARVLGVVGVLRPGLDVGTWPLVPLGANRFQRVHVPADPLVATLDREGRDHELVAALAEPHLFALSQPGVHLAWEAELLERLDLRDVTLVQNDHAAALVLAGEHPERIARLVISSCEAFENYPPGLPGKNLRLTAMAPGGIFLAMHAMRLRPLRPLQTQRGVRRDLRKYASSARRRQMLEVCQRLRSFDRPALVVWTPEDRVQRPDHGRRLADLLPHAWLVEIPDSYTLIMRDQPEAFARTVREFVRASPSKGT